MLEAMRKLGEVPWEPKLVLSKAEIARNGGLEKIKADYPGVEIIVRHDTVGEPAKQGNVIQGD
jgi:hypothetical protein